MPVILTHENERDWLNDALPQTELASLLKPLPDDQLIAWPVDGKKLFRVADITDSSLIEPIKGF